MSQSHPLKVGGLSGMSQAHPLRVGGLFGMSQARPLKGGGLSGTSQLRPLKVGGLSGMSQLCPLDAGGLSGRSQLCPLDAGGLSRTARSKHREPLCFRRRALVQGRPIAFPPDEGSKLDEQRLAPILSGKFPPRFIERELFVRIVRRAGGEGVIACGFPRLASRCLWPLLALRAGGEGGIRTHGSLRNFGFQDRRNRPLYHLSCSRFASAHY